MKVSILFRRYFFLIGLFFSLGSCFDEYNLTTGDVIGNAKPEGVKIIFDRGDKKFSTISGTNGQYAMHNLEAGTYTVTFEKEGYFSFKEFGFQFIGGPSKAYLNGPGSLSQKYTATVNIQSVTKGSNHGILITGSYQKNDDVDDPHRLNDFNIQWFINDQKGVSPTNYKSEFSSTCYDVQDGETFTSGCYLDEDRFGNASTIYIVGYAKYGGYVYYDWEMGRYVFAISEKPSNEWTYAILSDFYH
jgi:hypothetical protein